MSATLLRLPERSQASDASLHDLRFRALLGKRGMGCAAGRGAAALFEAPQRQPGRALSRPGGRDEDVRARLGARAGLQAVRCAAAAECRKPAARALVSVSEESSSGGQCWTRIYARPGHFPQVIHSAKRFCGPTGLEEYLGRGLGMALRVQALDDGIAFVSDHYFLRSPGGGSGFRAF